MTNNLGENKEVICLSNRLIFHCVIFILVLISHIIIFLKIYWMKNLFKLLFFSFSFIEVVYILVSIIPFILIKCKKLQTRIKHFIIISKIFFFFSLLIGLFFFIIIIINTVLVKNFCIECPFNLSFSYFVSNFDENFENKDEFELKNNCRERRCIFNKYDENSKYPYSYLCNYDPEEEFGVKDGEFRLINCKLFEPWYRDDYFSDERIYIFLGKYLDKCFNLTNFYYCGRLEKPKKYVLGEDEKCPKKNYIYAMYLLFIYIFIFDVVINIIMWYLQIISYDLLSKVKIEVTIASDNKNPIINNNNQIESTNTNNNGNYKSQNNKNTNEDNNNNQNDKTTENNNSNNINIINKENENKNLNNTSPNDNIRKETDSDFNPRTMILKNNRNTKKKDKDKERINKSTISDNYCNTTRQLKQKK